MREDFGRSLPFAVEFRFSLANSGDLLDLRDGIMVLGNEANHEQALACPIGLGLGPRGFDLLDQFFSQCR